MSASPNKSELVCNKAMGEYAFTFGMTLNKYANSTVPPIHRATPVLFCNSDEKSGLRGETHVDV